MNQTNSQDMYSKEVLLHAKDGMSVLMLSIMMLALAVAAIVVGAMLHTSFGTFLIIIGSVYLVLGWIPFLGLRVLKPHEALVLTLFGRYTGTIKGGGFFFVHPFSSSVNPAAGKGAATATLDEHPSGPKTQSFGVQFGGSKIISLKAMTLNNDKQKVNDQLGNPVEIGLVVIWRVVNTAKAVFNVDNYKAFLSIQCDSVLRDVAKEYPYDVAEDGEMSLRGSSIKVAERLKNELQSRVEVAGLEIMQARITHLAYAREIAAVMLQRQQASAIIDARKMIVDGAVGMVEMALDKLKENDVVYLDDERKAAMVSNLLVVLCGSKDAQPVVNSGSLY